MIKFIVSLLFTAAHMAAAQSAEEVAALMGECSHMTAVAAETCAPQTTTGQDHTAQAMNDRIGPAQQGGIQVTHQHGQLSQAVYETAMVLADQCEDRVTACEQSCRAFPDSYQVCHHDLRERLLTIRSQANAAVIAQGMAGHNQLAMSESGVDYAMGPPRGSFTIDVSKEGGGTLSPQEQADFAKRFNSDPTIDNGTDGDFKGNRVIGKYDATVTDEHIRKQASEAAGALGMGANVVVTPDQVKAPPAATATPAPNPGTKDPATILESLKPSTKGFNKGLRTPRLGRPEYCAQNPTQIGC